MAKKRPEPTMAKLMDRLWNHMSRTKRMLLADYRGMVSCVTCGTLAHWKELDGGHYRPKSLGMAARFDWFNFWPQCRKCNHFMSGNLGKFAIWIQDTLGRKELDRLETITAHATKVHRFELLERIEFWKQCEKEAEGG